MGPRLRGDDAAAHFDAHFHPPIGVNCRFQVEQLPRVIPETLEALSGTFTITALAPFKIPDSRKRFPG